MLDRLRQVYDRILADSESDTEGDGYLSWKAEWHAAGWGLSSLFLATLFGQWELAGLVAMFLITGQRQRSELNIPYPKQIAKESLYALGHGAIGATLGTLTNFVVGILL